MDIHFRYATEDDLEAIVEIYNQAVMQGFTSHEQSLSVEDRVDWFRKHSNKTRPIWVAIGSNQDICGWVSVRDYYGNPAYRHTAEISVYVSTENRGQGLGSALVDLVNENARSKDILTLIAVIYADNLPSIKLFENKRFERWGLMPSVTHLFGQTKDVVLMGYSYD